MATLSCSALFPALVPVIEALGGINPESVTSITDFVSDYASQVDDVLSSKEGASAYITACRQRRAAHQRESAPWDELLLVALDSFMLPPARRMRDWDADRRSRQVTSILRGLHRDVQAYLNGLLSAAEAAAVIPPQGALDSVTAQQPTNEATSSHAPPRYNGDASRRADCPGGPATLPATRPDDATSSLRVHTDPSISAPSDRERISFAYSLRDDSDPLRRVAAGQLVHLRIQGNKGRILEHFPSVAMLRDVALRLASLETDLPFVSASVEPHSIRSRLFPALEILAIDMRNAGSWGRTRVAETLVGLQADLVPDVRLNNASIACVHICGSLVRGARTCIIVHDWGVRDLVFVDRRGFRRSVEGDFINAIPFIFHASFFDGITDLTLTEEMPKDEVKLLFTCFPRALEHLRLLFGHLSCVDGPQVSLLAWRDSGRACCAALRRLTLTTKSPVDNPEYPSFQNKGFSLKVDWSYISAFVNHLHGNRYSERADQGIIISLSLEGGVYMDPPFLVL